MPTTIEVNKQSVEALLGSGKSKPFVIPEYQRPYAWTDEQVETLFEDLWDFTATSGGTERESSYFLGSVVSYENEDGEQEIIDGQQRITSLFLLLRAIYTKLVATPASERTAEANNFIGKIEPTIWRTNTATCIGVTSLIFAAQGNVWAPILMTIFCIQYAIISYRFRYWGEMFTYLFMSLPMSVWSIVTWLKNARNSSDGTVEIRKITRKGAGVLVLCNVAVTIAFYILLKKLNTPNLIFSTISVVTSFFAASLTMLRSSYYALGYASNDIVLIILWILASIKDPGYIPVVVNFLIFFLNDMYGFICWKKRETAQC